MLQLTDGGGGLKDESPEKEKKIYIEFLRIAACFFVIANHTHDSVPRGFEPSLSSFAFFAYLYISKTAVPLFLMITGGLLLKKQDTPKKSRERFGRILLVLLIGSLCFYAYHRDKEKPFSIFRFLRFFFMDPLTGAYWYLYLYLALMCLLPLLQRMAGVLKKNEVKWLLFLSIGVLGIAPIFTIWFPSFHFNHDFISVLFSPYIGLLFAGYYIECYMKVDRRSFYLSALTFVLLTIFQVLATYRLYQVNPETHNMWDECTLITVMGSAVCFYIMVKYVFSVVALSEWFCKITCFLGKLTFGIYLVSDFFVVRTRALFVLFDGRMPSFLAMVMWGICIFFMGAVITILLRAIPWLRKLL